MAYTSPYDGTVATGSAIVLKLNAAQASDGKTWVLQDDTGNYNASTNVGGWGAPNKARTDVGPIATVTGILMEIQRPEDDDFEYGLSVPLTFINPGGSGNDEFTIAPEDIGYDADTVIPDGVYIVRFLVEVTGANPGWVQPLSKYSLLAHDARCLVYNSLAALAVDDCDCNSTAAAEALNKFAMYKSMLFNAAMGKIEKVEEQLDCINDDDCGCNC